MAITKDSSVQSVEAKVVTINLADVLPSGTDYAAMDLPPNSIITSGSVFTTEAWNSTSTDVLDVGDGASQNRYLNDGNIRAVNSLVALVPTGFVHTGGPITVRWVSGGGSPTTGKVRLLINYVTVGKANSTYDY